MGSHIASSKCISMKIATVFTLLWLVQEISHMPEATIYTAPECPHSKKLIEFLKQNKIEFQEKCLLTSLDTIEEMKRISGQLAIPVTVIGDGIFIGFDSRVERRIKRQLGV